MGVTDVERLDVEENAEGLYCLDCSLPATVAGRPSVEHILGAITDEVRQSWIDCPQFTRDRAVERPPDRYGGLQYEFLAEVGKAWVGEVLWRSVHPMAKGAAITTWVLLEERPAYTRLAVRVSADQGRKSVRGYIGAGQAQPPFLHALRATFTPTWLGGPLKFHTLARRDIDDFVASVLASPTRDHPVAVLAPLEEGGYTVDPADLTWDLLGRAKLYVLSEHDVSFALSDAVGDRRMSCYWGAARAYMPGWTRHDDPLDHPLLVRDRLEDPLQRATWTGELGVAMCDRVSLPPGLEARRPSSPEPVEDRGDLREAATAAPTPPGAEDEAGMAPRESPGENDEAEPRVMPQAGPPPHETALANRIFEQFEPLAALPAKVTALAELVHELLATSRHLADEVERLRTISAVRSSSTNAIERRLGRLEALLEEAFPDGRGWAHDATRDADLAEADGSDEFQERDDEGRLTVADVVRDMAGTHDDALLFLDSAHASAAESPYEDPERVRAVLEAMARVARRRRDGALGTSLRDAFSDLGIDYRGAIARSTPERLRQQYRFRIPDGDVVEAVEHIALGNTYDPRRCVRIYFSSRVPGEARFVVGHVGRHFEVITST